jgi:hypothetical protein
MCKLTLLRCEPGCGKRCIWQEEEAEEGYESGDCAFAKIEVSVR